MNHFTKIALVCLLIIGISGVIFLFKNDINEAKHDAIIYAFNDPSLKAFVKKSKSSEGNEDDPKGRAHYELLRHQNPQTGEIPDNIHNKEFSFLNNLNRNSYRQKSARSAANEDDLWIQAGPYNIGGRTRAIALDVTDPTEKTILAGGVTGGMWRSEDGGKTWLKTTLQNQMHSVSCVAQDPREGKQQIWYYGTGEMNFIDDIETGLLKGNGVFKSLDGGKTWNVLSSTQTSNPQQYDSPFDYTFNIVVDHHNTSQEELYVAASGGIYRSMNGGESWQRVLGTGNPSGRYTDIVISSNGTLYASISNINGSSGVDAGIYRSEDGVNWSNLTPGWWPIGFNRVVLGISASNDNKLYVLADRSTFSQKEHILARYDMSTWTDLSANLPDHDYNTGDYDSQISFCMYIKVKPSDDQTVFLGGINLYRSSDGFSAIQNTTWIGGYDSEKTDLSKYPNHHPDQHALVFFNNPDKMLSAHDGGISETSDNLEARVQWESLNTGYITTQFYSVAMNNAKTDDVVIGGMQDNGSYGTNTIKGNDKWQTLLSGDGSFSAISNNGKRYYVSSQYGRIFRLDFNANGTYSNFTRVDPEGGYDYLFSNPFVLDPINSNMMYLAGGHNLLRNDNLTDIPVGSNDPATSGWQVIESTETDGIISALAISSTPSNIVYYGTSNGHVYRVDEANTIHASRTEVTGVYFPKYFGNPTGFVSSICVDPFDANKVFVTFSNYETRSIFYSENGGIEWRHVSGNLEQNQDGSGSGPAVYWLSMLHFNDGTTKYFAGTSIGLFFADELPLQGNKTIWKNSESIGAVPVYMIQARQKDGRILVATHGNGIYRNDFPNAATPLTEPISTIKLGQNYPNPFQSASGTKIPFSLDEGQFVSLKVYDSQGKEIANLINEEFNAGLYEFDLNDVPSMKALTSGIYYYTIRVGGFSNTKKMVVY